MRAVVSLILGKRYQLSYVYPFLSINYLLSVFLGYVMFDEEVTAPRVLGSLIILAGVCMLSVSRNKVEPGAR